MYSELFDWLTLVLGDRYEQSAGQWVDSKENSKSFIVAAHASGGPEPVVDVRRPRYRVILLGPRNGRQYNGQVGTDAGAIAALALSGVVPCGAANIRAMEPVGPGYTKENRPWYSIELQITY